MASERSTEHLIDLLYDELTEEEEISLRQELEESAEMRDEYAALKALVGEVDEAVPMVEVPSSLHAAIMAAAEAESAQSVADEVRAVRRPAAPAGREPMGIWRRLRGTQVSQVALVATVLFAGAFVFRYLDNAPIGSPIEYEERPAVAQLSEEAAPAAPSASEAPELDKLAPSPELAEEKMAEGFADGAAEDRGQATGTLQKERMEWAPGDRDQSNKDELAAKTPRADAPKPAKKVQSRKRSKNKPSPRPQTKGARLNDAIAGADLDDSYLNAKDEKSNVAAGASSAGKAGTKITQSKSDSATIGAFDEPSAEPAVAEQEAQKPAEYRPEPNSLDAVEEAYETGDYKGTVAASDRVLSSKAPSTQKARALELKAQAYARMGLLQQADSTYRNLQNNYPTYNSARVNSAREDISRRLNQKRSSKKKRKSAPKKSYDFEASESAPKASPSSLD